MNHSSLLYLEPYANRKSISLSVFDDVNLSKLLPESIIQFMQIPCTRNEIEARQMVFREMENKEFCDTLENLRSMFVSLHQANQAYKLAKNKCEQLILFRRYALWYLQIYDFVAGLQDCSPLLMNFKRYFNTFTPAMNELRPALEKTVSILQEIASSLLYFSPSCTTIRQGSGADEGLYREILLCLKQLGFDLPETYPQSKLRIESVFADAIMKLYESHFAYLRDFMRKFSIMLDEGVAQYRLEIEFYLSVYALIQRANGFHISVCYPKLSQTRVFQADSAYDVSLIIKNNSIVANDIDFTQGDSVYFLTGANGGGKTTYLRAVAINLLLAVCGCPVFCKSAKVYPFSGIYTHFPADERFTGSGRLVEEKQRADEIMNVADCDSFVFLNETYSGTDDKKGAEMTIDTAQSLKERGAFSLYVTHFHETNDHGIPMLNTVIDTSDSNRRTFKILKSTTLRSSYAYDILKKYNLTQEALKERLAAAQ